MKFLYRSVIADARDGEDFFLLRRPEIPISLTGPANSRNYLGLADTGSDHTILPMTLARYLGISVRAEIAPASNTFGGHAVSLFVGEVTFTLRQSGQSIRWMTEACFFEFPDLAEETLLLGHAGFLDFFTATFDGKLGTLELVPNDELPTA